MNSRNTNIQIPRLVTEPSALQSHNANKSNNNSNNNNSSSSSKISNNFVRKPRFHEDFDAPLLLELLDASPTSPYGTNNSSQSTSPSSSRPSLDYGAGKAPSRGPLLLPKRTVTSPIIHLQNEWSAEPRRRVSVHDKMRKLARRSMIIVRQRPSRIDDDVAAAQRPTTSVTHRNESSEHLAADETNADAHKAT